MKYIILLLLAVVAAVMPAVSNASNLLENPGFELEDHADAAKAAGWDIWMGERLNEFKHSGDWSLHSWAFDGEGDGGAWRAMPASAGSKISFQGYLMSPKEGGYHTSPLLGGAEAFLELEWFQGETKLGSEKSSILKGASDWKLYEVTGTAPAGADSVRFICKIKIAPGSSGDIYFDDLSVSALTK